ncbi:MAG TPA: ATP-binding protein [Candidatus Latescibacteria bacterium]|nr:ATP-binding protein [Candidatus Latescibacterota bacterium]
MVYRKFRVAVSLRLALLFVWVGLFFYVLIRTELTAGAVLLGLLIVAQIWGIFRTIDRTNRDLARFFDSVRFGDFSQTFREKSPGGSFAELHAALAKVIEAFRTARAEKEEQALYLQTVVQHIGIGLLVFQPDGEVELINDAARRLLKLGQLKNIRNLEGAHPELVGTLLRLKPREHGLVKVETGDEQLQLSLYAAEFKLRGREFTLVSVQDIRSELEEKEIEAWQKLIRVLTHEIMNSMTPISSLATTVQDLVAQNCGAEGESEVLGDIHAALRTIQKRSEGLLHFVDGYRNLARLSKPNLKLFPASGLFADVAQLLQVRFAEGGIRMNVSANPANLDLLADPDLLEQVLINLLLNAADAVRGRADPLVELVASLDERGRPVIQVRDNGSGIAEDNLDKVFVPFFSTKEGGSGIGLSLSRQIMRLHGGSITAASKPGLGTVFTLRFKH